MEVDITSLNSLGYCKLMVVRAVKAIRYVMPHFATTSLNSLCVSTYVLYMDPPKLEYDNPITWGIFKFQFWVKMWILTKIIPEYDQLPLCWKQTFSLCPIFAVHIAS